MKERKFPTQKMKKYEDSLRNDEKSEATIEKYLRDVRCFSSFVGKEQINKEMVMEYKASLGKDYAVASANSMIASLNSFFRFCGWYDLCVKQFRVQRDAFCSENKELTKAEYTRLVNTAKRKNNERLCLIIQTICSTGIRVSELEYITAEAVTRGEATVKCKGKNRRIFIISELRKKLLSYMRDNGIKSGAVFVTKKGKPINRSNIWKEMKSLCKEANVSPSKVFPHNLRHLFARTFYSIEKDIAKLADILGHASINTTRVYIVSTGAEHKRKLENMRLVV